MSLEESSTSSAKTYKFGILVRRGARQQAARTILHAGSPATSLFRGMTWLIGSKITDLGSMTGSIEWDVSYVVFVSRNAK